MEQYLILFLAIGLVIVAIGLFWIARHQQRQTGLPAGRIIYADTSGWVRQEQALFDPGLHLTGKPDYLVDHNDQVIPVEVKSTRGVSSPYDTHVYQLAAYCLLVSRVYGRRPDYGLLHYPDQTFVIDFTPALENEVIALMTEMRSRLKQKDLNRSHEQSQRCLYCGYRFTCDQTLRI